MRDALTGLGYPVTDDYHVPGALGVSRAALTVRDGSAFDQRRLPRAGPERPNLVVRGDTLVDRVVLDGAAPSGSHG